MWEDVAVSREEVAAVWEDGAVLLHTEPTERGTQLILLKQAINTAANGNFIVQVELPACPLPHPFRTSQSYMLFGDGSG